MVSIVTHTMQFNLGQNGTNLNILSFLDKEQAAKAIVNDDAFFSSMSSFDKESRGFSGDSSKEEIKEFYANQTLSWDESGIDKLIPLFEVINSQLNGYHLNLPEEIQLILTTGLEEGTAAYCRNNAIILTEHKIQYPRRDLQYMLTHELFHIFSPYNPELRKQLYELIGYKVGPKLAPPEDLVDFLIINPDTFKCPCYIELRNTKYMPIIYSKTEFGNYSGEGDYRPPWKGEPMGGTTFFDYMTFGLIEVKLIDEKAIPVIKNGKPTILDERDLPEYLEIVGSNTEYFVHPEEILADNFLFMVNHFEHRMKNPEIIIKMREILSK